jgi:hypothetical protein
MGIDPTGKFSLVETLVVAAVTSIISGMIGGTISAIMGGSFAEGFASSMMTAFLFTFFVVFIKVIPAALAASSGVSRYIIEQYVYEFKNPIKSAMMIYVAIVAGFLLGGINSYANLKPDASGSVIALKMGMEGAVKYTANQIAKITAEGASLGTLEALVNLAAYLASMSAKKLEMLPEDEIQEIHDELNFAR